MLIVIQGSPSGCGCLEIPGVSQVEKEEHRRSYVYEPMAGVVPIDAAKVVPLLYVLRGCF